MDSKVINTIKKIIQQQSITIEELNEFITSYVEKTKGKVITTKELADITFMLQQGIFNLHYAAEEYAKLLNYQVLKVIDMKTNTIKKIIFYEL